MSRRRIKQIPMAACSYSKPPVQGTQNPAEPGHCTSKLGSDDRPPQIGSDIFRDTIKISKQVRPVCHRPVSRRAMSRQNNHAFRKAIRQERRPRTREENISGMYQERNLEASRQNTRQGGNPGILHSHTRPTIYDASGAETRIIANRRPKKFTFGAGSSSSNKPSREPLVLSPVSISLQSTDWDDL